MTRPDGGAWQEAVGVTFQDNGRAFVWERGGQVWIIDRTNPVPAAFLAISDEVGAWHDHGFLGFALDPGFTQNGFVYLMYLVDRHQLLNCAEPASGTGAPICNAAYDPAADQFFDATIGRVTRYQALLPTGDADYANATAFDPGSRTVLIGATAATGIPSTSRSHVTGSLVFGSDGSLLITTGDGSRSANDTGSSSTAGDARSYTAQALADGIIDGPQDVGSSRAQMIDSLSGKVLRIDPASGLGLPDNPFYDAANPGATRSKVWALGLRNPYRASLWPNTGSFTLGNADPGTLIIGDVGRQAWEEINMVETAGQNFGWPMYEGMNLFVGNEFGNGRIDNAFAPNPLFNINGCTEEFFQFDDLLVQETQNPPVFLNPCDAQVQIDQGTPTHMHTRPVLTWTHQSAITKSKGFDASGVAIDYDIDNPASPIQGTPFLGTSVTGGFVYQGSDLPAEYSGNYFFGDYTGQWIRRLVFDPSNQPVSVASFSEGAEVGGVVHLAGNPIDGGVYFIPWTVAVKRLDYAPNGNFVPQANLVASPVFGPGPLITNFDASASTDPEGTALSYLWDFGDGTSSTAAVTQHTYNATGVSSYNVVLTVTDAGGAQDSASVVVSPNNTPPSVTIISPVDNSQYLLTADTTYDLLANISDSEHAVSSMACTWSVRLNHNTHFHGGPLLQGCQAQAVISPAGCDGDSYFWQVEVTVTDPGGLVATDRVRLNTPDCAGGNFPPVANGDLASVPDGGTVNIAVLSNDIDDVGLQADSLVLTGPSPANGTTAVNAATGEIIYQHTGIAGSVDTITYRVNDTAGLTSNDATVVVQSIAPGTASPNEPISFVVSQDSFTRFTAAGTNFGTQTVVRVQPWGNSTGFANFDLSAFPAGVVATSAQLTFSVNSVKVDGTVTVHKVLGNWDELSLNENNKPALGPVETSFVVTAANNGQSVTVDITNLFNQLHADPANNFGIALVHAGANLWIDSRESGLPMQMVAVPGGPPTNTAPQVNAGSNFTATVASPVPLGGSVSDDGLPNPPASYTALWTAVSGPGTVTFTDATDPGSGVSFDTTGAYVLRLSGDDSALQNSDDVVVTVVQPSSDLTFAVSRDSFTRSTAAGTNFGTQPVVRVQPWGNSTGFANFDLSAFPAGVVATSAQLVFSTNSVKVDGSVTVHKVLGNWDELSLTENNKPALGPVETSFVVTAANGQSVVVDITNLFNQLHADPVNNFGIALVQAGANVWIDSRESGSPMQIVATPGGPPANTAPQVNAGSDQAVTLPANANLSGSVVDDGLPAPPAQTTVSWDLFSGPGTVNFGSPGNLDTTVSFTLPGLYELRLTATDSEFTASDTVLINVIDPNANQAPSANAGSDFSVAANATIALAGSVADDGLPNPPATTTASWSMISGAGSVNFTDSTDPRSTVSFDTVGAYVLRLTANDSALQQSDDVAVTVADPSVPQTFNVVQDTYARDSAPGQNFGSESLVRVQTWGNATGFVRFDLSSFPSGALASSAQLVISANSVRRAGDISVHKILQDWQEFGLTYNNRPSLGPASSTFNVSTSDGGQSIQIDITDVFNQLVADPASDYGFAMVPGTVNLWIDSRESASPMRIIATQGQAPDLAFTDITASSGTGGPDFFGGHGIQFADTNNSGLPDFYVKMNQTSFGDMADLLYINADGSQFTEEAAARGVENFDRGSHGGVFADFDNDGDFDIYNGSYDQNILYLNNGNGVFTDNTVASGLPARLWPTRGVAAFDMDLDGDLDIVAINGYLGSGDPPDERNEFYRNDGNAAFTAVDLEPLFSAPSGQGVTDVDYDNDGDIDLFTANRNGDVVILRNVSGTGFEIVAPANIGIDRMAGDGISFADVNNDGYLDALLDDQLFISDQDGTFSYSTTLSGPQIPYMGGFADLDLDGDLDIVFPGASFVYLNDGAGVFSPGPSISLGVVNDPRSVAFADIDNDGDVDFFYAQKLNYNLLIRNDYAGPNRWLQLSLIRANGQAGAFGARVYIYRAGELNVPTALITWREVRSQDGYLSQSDPRINLGVGNNNLVDIRVVFPGGATTTLLNVATMQQLTIQE